MKKFSKVLAMFVIAAMVVGSIGISTAYAASETRGINFVDEDSDGICDYCGIGSRDGSGRQMGRGRNLQNNFVDADGDGVCDNFADRPQSGCGRMMGGGQGGKGKGMSENYIDADGDGVCDNFTNRPMDGSGNKMGRGKNR